MKKSVLIFAIMGVTVMNNVKTQTIIDQGDCGANGNNLTWVLTDDNVLTISGNGDMKDYQISNQQSNAPWIDHSSMIKHLVIGENVTSIGDNAFFFCQELSGTITFPSSVSRIGFQSFAYCCRTEPSSINIPSSVTEIRHPAFLSCIELTAINVDADNQYYSSIDGVLYNKQQSILFQYPGAKTGILSIPNTVTTISTYAVFQSKYLTSVIIGDAVTRIEEGAFLHCAGLRTLTIGSSVAIIAEQAFDLCENLTLITSKAIVPPAIYQTTFGEAEDIPVCVPTGSLMAYQRSDWGSQFANIQECEVGMDDIVSKTKISIYPNPATDYIEIETISQPKSNQISIYDITGRIIKSQILTDEITRLDLSTLTKGIYILKIDNQLFKVIKQ